MGGKDSSKQFWKYHNQGVLTKYGPTLKVGSLDTKKQKEAPKPAPKPAPTPAPAKASDAVATSEEPAEALEQFGDLVPYADPNWYQTVSCDMQRLHANPLLSLPSR
jgi:hypothetical protein